VCKSVVQHYTCCPIDNISACVQLADVTRMHVGEGYFAFNICNRDLLK
jgi:hypothetical protein